MALTWYFLLLPHYLAPTYIIGYCQQYAFLYYFVLKSLNHFLLELFIKTITKFLIAVFL
ncbi:hypothetical protein C3B79_1678 [Aeromonas hydrophila]|nr:hypothetical protein C3B79_1678 [Aeromonas hydrophila]